MTLITENVKSQSKVEQELLDFLHFRLNISLELEDAIDEVMAAWDGFLAQTINHKILLDNGGAYSYLNTISNNKEVFEIRNGYEYPKNFNPSKVDQIFLKEVHALYENNGLLSLNQRIGTHLTDLTMKNVSKMASSKKNWVLKFINYPSQFGPLHQTGVCHENYMIVLRQSSPMHYENGINDWRKINYAEDQVPVLPGEKIQKLTSGDIIAPKYMIDETLETKKIGRKCLVLINDF